MNHVRLPLPILLCLLPTAGLLSAAAPTQTRTKATPPKVARTTSKPAADTFKRDAAPLLQKYCYGCHAAQNPSSGLALAGYQDSASVVKARDLWERVSRNVVSNHMPRSVSWTIPAASRCVA
jgi:hypothetical protein